VQPGFNDVAPGMVPTMKEDPDADIHDKPGGRFVNQLDNEAARTEGEARERKRSVRPTPPVDEPS
jgi:hypothetical protein